MKRPLIFVGSRNYMSGLAVTAELMGIEVLGIIDYQYYGNTTEISGIPVIGSEHWLLEPNNCEAELWRKSCDFFVATLVTGEQEKDPSIDRERLRYQRISLIESLGLSTINLVDPESRIMRGAKSRFSKINLGRGIYIAPFVDFAEEGLTIGDFCTFEHHCFIGHHQTIGKNVTMLPAVELMHCDVGDHAVIGHGSWTHINERSPKFRIGDWSTVWSQTCIKKDCPDNHIYTNTGRVLKKHRSLEWINQIGH